MIGFVGFVSLVSLGLVSLIGWVGHREDRTRRYTYIYMMSEKLMMDDCKIAN